MASDRPSEEPTISSEEASQIVKRFAAKQKVAIELTQDQLDALLRQWDDVDPRQPAELTFYVERKEQSNLTVAGYRYKGDTCCV